MPPIVAIVGRSESGKTTLIEKLVPELKSRRYRVATIKHTHRDPVFDQPEKDSWRHIQAGSEITAVGSQDKIVVIKTVAQPPTLDQIARCLGEDCDIIIAEGFKKSGAPKIEVHRKESGPPLTTVRKLIAIVTDEPLETKARQFSPEDVKGLADLLEKGFIVPQRQRAILYVNENPVTLTMFPKEFITSTIVGMLSTLKGVERVKSIDLFLRKKPD
ncbi:molybdopterin-guanine dinucleotide biosynthesis protein B [Chloroflexota bacterium]